MVRFGTIGALSSIRRWLEILLISVLGGAALNYAGWRIDSAFKAHIDTWFRPRDELDGIRLQCVIGIGLIALLHRLARTSLGHVRHALRYPPLPVCVLLGISFSLLAPSWLRPAPSYNASFADAGILVAAYLGIWLVQTTSAHFWARLKEDSSLAANGPERAIGPEISDEDLKNWLKHEDPVMEISWDLFGHAEIAKRLVDRLTQGESTIALQGEYGSGKSSVCAMAKAEAKRQGSNLIFVNASCWGFENAATAQKKVLEAILREVDRQVDCVSVRHLPSDYVEAVTAHAGGLKSLLQSWTQERTPLEQLQRLSPKLTAIRRKVVLVVEDVDRTGENFDVGRIQSLLMQFREVTGLSFILAISPSQQIDFAKLCDHLEYVPALHRRDVLQLIDQVRELALKMYPEDVILNSNQPLATKGIFAGSFTGHLEYHWPWHLSLSGLLNRPRLLKHALRRILDAWPRLHGEVHLDELISVVALRTCAPEAFAYLHDNYIFFATAAQSTDLRVVNNSRPTLKEELQKKWQKLSTSGRFDPQCVAALLKEIYGATAATTGLPSTHRVIYQSVNSERRGDIYARRLFTERCESNESSDQKILRLMKRAGHDSGALQELAETITGSAFATAAFDYFASSGHFNSHLQLLSNIHEVIRRCYGREVDALNLPAFYGPWQSIRLNRPPEFEDWHNVELKKCIPGHLRLATDIYYSWLGGSSCSRTQCESARKCVFDGLRASWTSMPPRDIPGGFDPSYPYTLFHLIFTTEFSTPKLVPYGEIDDWTWSGPLLLEAAKATPSVMLPQILIALNENSNRDGQRLMFSFDSVRLAKWFDNQSNQLLLLTAAGFEIPPRMSEQDKYLVNLAIQKAKEAVARGPVTVNGGSALGLEVVDSSAIEG